MTAEPAPENETPTAEDLAFFLQDAWKHAHDVIVDFVAVDSEGKINAFARWKVDNVDGTGETELSQNIRFRQYDDGRIGLI